MTTPKISIIAASYNNAQYFGDFFESLQNQTEKDFEVIVIDDASPDNSVEIIRATIENDPRFTLFVNEKNLGYQRTLIKGISMSKASVFGRVDSDDALAPEAIEKSLKAHLENPEVGLVYSNIVFCDENLTPHSVGKGKQIDGLDENYYNFGGQISHFATFKRSVYGRTSGIDPFIKRAEDKDLYMKMCEAAPVKYIDENLYLYRRLPGSLSSSYNKSFFWHWVGLIKMAERRNINLEDYFHQKVTEHYVLPKVKQFENSFAFKIFRIEQKLKSMFKK